MHLFFTSFAQRALGGLLLLAFASVHPAHGQATSDWADVDVGAVAAAGSSTASGSTVTVTGSGEDIGGQADEFHFRQVKWTGSGAFVARVSGLTHTHDWAKAGLMIRSGLSPDSGYVFAGVNPRGIASRLWRAAQADGSGTRPGGIDSALNDWQIRMPMWLRLVWNAHAVSASFSHDGVTWHDLGWQPYAPGGQDFHVGLAVTSRVDGTLATATFEEVSLVPEDAANVVANALSPTQVQIRWDNPAGVSSFAIERSTDGAAFENVGQWHASPWTDSSVAAGTAYHYRVRAIRPGETSGLSNVATVTTPALPSHGWGTVAYRDAAGHATFDGSTVIVTARAAGVGAINGTASGERGTTVPTHGIADEFVFTFQTLTGDAEIVARLDGIQGTDTARAGLMVRSGSADNAYTVFLGVAPSGYFGVLARDGKTVDSRFHRQIEARTGGAVRAALPLWLKLVRAGQSVFVSTSLDGSTWREETWIHLPLLGSVAHVGIAAASGGDTEAVARFEQVAIGPRFTAIAPPPVPGPLALDHRSTGSISFHWPGLMMTAEAFEVERAAGDGGFSRVATPEYASHWDGTVTAGTAYRYRVRALRGGVYSGYSDVLTVTAADPPAEETPQTPGTPIATALGVDRILVTWPESSTAEYQFVIESSTDGATFTLAGAAGEERNYFVHDRLQPGTTYYYRVLAKSFETQSAFSAVGSATTHLTPTSDPRFTVHPRSQSVPVGTDFTLVAGVDSPTVTYQWLRNGWVDAGGPLKSGMAQPGVAGIYAAVATDQGLSAESKAAIVAPLISERLAGDGKIVGTNIRHPNGNIYDQMQPTGFGMSATAEPGEVLRISYCDETDDIVQVEFSGAGTLSLLVVGGGPPAEARSYNQPGVQYVRGHAHIVIGGADESTNVAVFTVGRVTAVNQTLFRDDVAYDGVADVASLAIVSRNGKFGGIYGGNANFTAGDGFTGVYAPGVEFLGPVRIHNVRARANARPLLVTGHVAEIFIGGGDMERANAGPVEVGDVGRLRFVDAVDSHGRTLPAQGNRGRYVRDGVDVTSRIAP